jgi:hypothetical protein
MFRVKTLCDNIRQINFQSATSTENLFDNWSFNASTSAYTRRDALTMLVGVGHVPALCNNYFMYEVFVLTVGSSIVVRPWR